ncbi:formamidopyrimidine-DNA glycosylase isoform X2 [Vitis vinifera]|uniref:formamidopyrimidine-DNA glycosylase isoform X2 n=1 Tax=Vitis vinifera TaxID=29760 RepID=UPI00053FB464|nr:formamidopyrimidine-DNA glycosylase isoform X2 [Vitis vinifera]|eukprot:XP_010654820.1 PREDICTED: formamidopyrimidine-DNA glycosylase isoform X2 [Vitis vinifera]
MPELPEVEAARRAVEEHCVGKKITKAVIANDSKVIDGVSPSDFEASLLGKTIVSAHRKGKNMWLQLDSPPFPSFQFGMAGAVYIKGVAVTKYKRSAVKDTDEWPSKYSKLFIELDDGLELSFTDKRRFAKVRLLEDPASVPPISELGPDALLEPMTIDEFIKSLSKKKIAIKALLLDQSYIAGIGNWLADEVLYHARIHPLQVASSLTRESCETLHQCIKQVIQYAVEVDAECSLFPLEWLFHFRWGKKPGKVNGKKIDFISAGGRTTAYVPELQKLSGTQAAKASVKPRKQTPMRKKEENDEDDDDDDALDEPASEEEKNTKRAKSKKGQNPKGGGKKPPAKRKVEESDNDSDDNDDNNDDDDDDEDKDGDQKKAKRVTKNKQTKVEKTTKKKVEKSHKGKPMKKKVK